MVVTLPRGLALEVASDEVTASTEDAKFHRITE